MTIGLIPECITLQPSHCTRQWTIGRAVQVAYIAPPMTLVVVCLLTAPRHH